MSHGYTYKRLSINTTKITGKRMLCSSRYGKSGCGRTRQLYLADTLPKRRYPLSTLIIFIQTLLAGATVNNAFQHAVCSQTKDTRQAWVWLKDFAQSVSTWRITASLSRVAEQQIAHRFKQRSRRLSLLLPTLYLLSPQIRDYQWQFQSAFLN